MDQFSHDLTIALEETSRMNSVRIGRWGQRRRTCSTGNLPCAPQPTEDSSSSPADFANGMHNNTATMYGLAYCNNSILSDSDDKQDILRLPHNPTVILGNFESDSLNENFSPARFFRPNTRRKRKFKRMAVEYEATPPKALTTVIGENAENTIFHLTGTIKKRYLRHSIPDNFRTNLFFCGKRKRSHRDRYQDHEHIKPHSSSVPRQSCMYPIKNSFQELKIRPRSLTSTSKSACERILPLNKGLISKIEKISQQHKTLTEYCSPFHFNQTNSKKPQSFDDVAQDKGSVGQQSPNFKSINLIATTHLQHQIIPENFALKESLAENPSNASLTVCAGAAFGTKSVYSCRKQKYRIRREQMKVQLQFNDTNSMEWGELNDFLSSSSISSSESEDERTNDSDREGDDELTDWPGNEAAGIYDSKNDFKRKLIKKTNLPLIKSDESATIADDDTVMSTKEVEINLTDVISASNKPTQSAPIAINKCFQANNSVSHDLCLLQGDTMDGFRFPIKQIESEMSGETSNPFLASPPCQPSEVREIRAGCRRMKGERPGFSIKTSVNERLARFLQDCRQVQVRLPDIEIYEHESLINLANLYSLQMTVDNGCAVLTKTCNTTQSIQIDRQNLQSSLLFSDFKRRCYDGSSDNNSGGKITSKNSMETTQNNLQIFQNVKHDKDKFLQSSKS